jgi:hypothetical protein
MMRGSRGAVVATRSWCSSLAFAAVVFYLCSQVVAVPLLPLGPSWAVWPSLSDVAALLLVALSALFGSRSVSKHPPQARLLRWMFVFCAGASLSYLVVTLGVEQIEANQYGLFQLYRLAEFTAVYWAVARIPLDAKRIVLLRRVAGAVLVVACASVWATYFGLLPLDALVRHLPREPAISGPWWKLHVVGPHGWGALGYDHAYVALPIVILFALHAYLSASRSFAQYLLAAAMVGTVFLTGARSGLAAALVLFALLCLQSLKRSIATGAVVTVVVILSVWLPGGRSSEGKLGETAERQAALSRFYESESLNGRDEIWNNRIEFLNNSPARWLIGAGFGSAMGTGSAAHMLYLQIITEAGLIGFLVWLAALARLIAVLRRCPRARQTVLPATVAILVGAMSQEALYPIPASGHVIGLYLLMVALAVHPALWRREEPSVATNWRRETTSASLLASKHAERETAHSSMLRGGCRQWTS